MPQKFTAFTNNQLKNDAVNGIGKISFILWIDRGLKKIKDLGKIKRH